MNRSLSYAMSRISSTMLALCLLLTISWPLHAAPVADPIQLDAGKISGTAAENADGIRVYKGIPYAAPPVGDLRWKAPQPPAKWDDVRACTQFSKAGPQPGGLGIRPETTSEDSLYLNVWTGAKDSTEKRPVMYWIHGGAYYQGSAANYDGTSLAKQGIVVVTINYRLGPFGYFAHPQLSKESGNNASGNYQLMDMMQGLKWVQKNIAAFGGDPGNVTIFGESSGSGSVCSLVVSPLSKGLFHRAIMQSGTVVAQNPHLREKWYGLEPAEAMGVRIAKEMGLGDAKDQLAALRAKSADEILKAADQRTIPPGAPPGNRFIPIVDGYVIPDDPADIINAGKQQHVPIIIGSNADEGMMFVSRYPDHSAAAFDSIMKSLYGADAPAVAKFYPVKTDDDVTQALNKHMAQSRFSFGARRMAAAQAKSGEKTFMYFFTRVRPGNERVGANHASEIPFVFNRLTPVGRGGQVDATDQKLSDAMSAYWVNFARTGNPNGPGLPEWPAYDKSTDKYLEIGSEIKAGTGLLKEQLDTYDRINADKRKHRNDK